jgi:hypothetical protein
LSRSKTDPSPFTTKASLVPATIDPIVSRLTASVEANLTIARMLVK